MVGFQLERLDVGEDRLEVAGRWFGVRGMRFVRPALVVAGDDGQEQSLLATLEHKPWSAEEGELWRASFPWTGGPVSAADVQLAVAPSVVVPLAAPTPEERTAAERRAAEAERTRRLEAEVRYLREEREQPAVEPELETLRGQIAEAREVVDALVGERDAARRELEAARAELEAARAVPDPEPDAGVLAIEMEALRAELAEARADAAAVRDELAVVVSDRDRFAAERDARPAVPARRGGAEDWLARGLALGAFVSFALLLVGVLRLL